MKRIILLVLVIVFVSPAFAQNDTIAGWTFPDETEASFFADLGVESNLQQARLLIESDERPLEIVHLHGLNAAACSGWQNVTDIKYWKVTFDASDFTNISFSFDQRTNVGMQGPEFFKLQYKLENQAWKDVENGDIQIGNTWDEGVFEGLVLPEECDHYRKNIEVRWLATSDLTSSGQSVSALAESFIRNIIVKGTYEPIENAPILTSFEFSSLLGIDLNPVVAIEQNLELPIQIMKEDGGETNTIKPGGLGYFGGCASVDGWDQGLNNMYWMIQFYTENYINIKLSSRQASKTGGPASFIIQYKKGEGEWTDVENGQLNIDSGWEAGKVDRLLLPAECEKSDELISVRWLMNEDVAVDADAITPNAKSVIDEIFVTGNSIEGEKELLAIEMNVYPVPCDDYLLIKSEEELQQISIIDLSGRIIKTIQVQDDHSKVNTSDIKPGMYILMTQSSEGKVASKKIIKQ